MEKSRLPRAYVPIMALVAAFILLAANAGYAPVKAVEGPSIELPADTPITLELKEQLYSQRNREGDEIIFAVAEDVVIDGRTCLVEGTPVTGIVQDVRPARSFGRRGYLDVEVETIYPLYSDPIPLAGDTEETGDENIGESAGTIGAGIVLGATVVGLVAGGAIQGGGAVIEPGTTFTVQTRYKGEIMAVSESEMERMVSDWYYNKVIDAFMNYSWDDGPALEEAVRTMGYSITRSMILIEKIDDTRYMYELTLGPETKAIFTLKPFEEPHLGKFVTLEPINDMAQTIFNEMQS